MTIYDIAREAGVSASTVSRVINNKAGIKESTRKKVQKLLDEYNYTPDVAARGLVTQASKFIGILIEDIRVSHHTESAYVIEQEMTRQGYTCITFSTGADSKRKAQYIDAEVDGTTGPRSSVERGRCETAELLKQMPDVDGILCATDMLAIGCMQELKAHGIAVPEQVAVIGVDNTLYGQLCTPALTTLDNKLGEVSFAAANMLLDVLQDRPVSHKLMLLTEIIQRETT